MLGKHPVLQNLFLSPEDSAISVNAECFSSSEIAVYNLSSDGGIFFFSFIFVVEIMTKFSELLSYTYRLSCFFNKS